MEKEKLIALHPYVDPKRFAVNLRREMTARGLTAKQMQEICHVKYVQTVYKWMNGKTLPDLIPLLIMSKLFDMKITELAPAEFHPEEVIVEY